MGKKIIFTKHALDQIKVRGLTKVTVKAIHRSPNFIRFDTLKKNYVAIKEILYKDKMRYVSVSFNKETTHDKIVTVKPEKRNNVLNKIKKGRWVKL